MVEPNESELALTNQLDTLVLNPLPPESRQPMLRFPLGAEDSALVPL